MESKRLREIFASYIKKGFYLFPIIRETKMPAIENNLNRASNDIEQLMRWAAKFPNCNWALSCAKSGVVAVDIDEDPIKLGMEKWAALLVQNNEDPKTLKAQSGGGGLHYIFKAKPGIQYRGRIGKKAKHEKSTGMDVKHNGYVLLYPSIHMRTKLEYKWLNDLPISAPPKWVDKLIIKDLTNAKPKLEVDFKGKEFYQKLCAQLATKPFGYDEWLKIGMALHSAFEGSDTGLALFLEVTEGANYNEGDSEIAIEKWKSFNSSAGGVNGGTLVYLARDLGCDVPNSFIDEDKAALADALGLKPKPAEEDLPDDEDDDPEGLGDETDAFDDVIEEQTRLSGSDARRAYWLNRIEEEKDANPGWFRDDRGRIISVHVDHVVKDFNETGYALLTGAAEGQIVRAYPFSDGTQAVKTMNFEHFRNSTSNKFFKYYEESTGGNFKPKMRPAQEIWIQSGERKQFSDIVFRPVAEADQLNLWSPIPCKRIKGDVSELLDFLRDVICDGHKGRFKYLLQWCAQLVQTPHIKSAVVPVLVGEQGTGKGFFTEGLMKGILGRYYAMINKPGVLKEKFNAEQSRKFMTVLDEASWQGDANLSNLLKSLTGNDTMTVEEKFGGRYSIENYTRYVVTSNDRAAVRIETSNRRYLILEVSKNCPREVYEKLWNGVKKGDLCGRFYNFLMRVNLDDFKPFAFPENLDTAGRHAKLSSLGPVGSFWYEVFFNGRAKVFIKHEGQIMVPAPAAFTEFVGFRSEIKGTNKEITSQQFWHQSREMMPILLKESVRVYLKEGRVRAQPFGPLELMESFCARVRIAQPKDFEVEEHIREANEEI